MSSRMVTLDPICGHPITAADLEREIRFLRTMRMVLPKIGGYVPVRQNVARKIKQARKMLRGAR